MGNRPDRSGGSGCLHKASSARRESPSGAFAKAGLSERLKVPGTPCAASCPVANTCGACSFIEVPYAQQLAEKQSRIEELFAGLAEPSVFRPIIGMENPFHYRNKVASPFAPGRGKRKGAFAVDTGMYAKGTHRLVRTDGCLIENEVGNRVVAAVRSLMLKWKIAPYDEDTGTGFMRHVVVRVGAASGEVLVTLVTNADGFPSSKSFCRELVRRVPEITTVVQNVNMRQTNVILGDAERTLYGPGFILDTLCGLSFRISSQSFYQVNPHQTEKLYAAAVDAAALDGAQTVIDAYCGTGTIGLVAASRGAARVIGVDSVKAAIRDARQNAAHNGVANAEFFAEDATVFLQRMAASKNAAGPKGRADETMSSQGPSASVSLPEVSASSLDLVLMMDPPRAGSTPQFLDAACALAPGRIVYISCNPLTQVRDARHLLDGGYHIERVQPVDMFPHTDHIENIVVFVK